MAPEPRTHRFTTDDVTRMIEAGILAQDEPVELIDGELIVVSPQGPSHASYTNEIADRLRAVYRPGYAIREEKPVTAGEHSLPGPDIAVVRGNARDYRTHHPGGEDTVVVIEIAKTSQADDRRKCATYAAGGHQIYWLLDLAAHRLEVYTEPTPDGRYRVVHVLDGDDELQLPETDVHWRVATLCE